MSVHCMWLKQHMPEVPIPLPSSDFIGFNIVDALVWGHPSVMLLIMISWLTLVVAMIPGSSPERAKFSPALIVAVFTPIAAKMIYYQINNRLAYCDYTAAAASAIGASGVGSTSKSKPRCSICAVRVSRPVRPYMGT
ncbi:hypothetical protein Ancab_004632 [Ancistrocladus abbreviatus]